MPSAHGCIEHTFLPILADLGASFPEFPDNSGNIARHALHCNGYAFQAIYAVHGKLLVVQLLQGHSDRAWSPSHIERWNILPLRFACSFTPYFLHAHMLLDNLTVEELLMYKIEKRNPWQESLVSKQAKVAGHGTLCSL